MTGVRLAGWRGCGLRARAWRCVRPVASALANLSVGFRPVASALATVLVFGCGGAPEDAASTGDAAYTGEPRGARTISEFASSGDRGSAKSTAFAAGAAAAGNGYPPVAAAGNGYPPVKVYKTSGCGCCNLWVDHMRGAGFEVEAEDVHPSDLVAIKMGVGLVSDLYSCHTATVGEYAFEGHIPAEVIARFLSEEPDLRGLAVPGMPTGSPGMEVGDRKEPYDIIGFRANGERTVYERR